MVCVSPGTGPRGHVYKAVSRSVAASHLHARRMLMVPEAPQVWSSLAVLSASIASTWGSPLRGFYARLSLRRTF